MAAETLNSEYCFLGEHEYTLDKQRRLALPREWRGSHPASNHFYLLPGRGKSLQLVPAPMFQDVLLKLRKVSFADAEASVALATIGSMAQEVLCDNQGRFALSPRLMSHAGIADKVLLLGSVTTIQVWEPGMWQAQRMDSELGLKVMKALQERPDDFTEVFRRAIKD
jgi:MraZ protein